MVLNFKNRAIIYDRLHHGSVAFLGLISIGLFGYTGYRYYIFKTG